MKKVRRIQLAWYFSGKSVEEVFRSWKEGNCSISDMRPPWLRKDSQIRVAYDEKTNDGWQMVPSW
jgi:hypothetical protein